MRRRRGNTVQTHRLGVLMLAALAPITLGGSAAWAENLSMLYSFKGTPDGGYPEATLLNVGGTLYGTTVEGGANDYGSVFTITPAGVETVIYSFKGTRTGPDGDGPAGPLIDVGGTLYGTTIAGGIGGGTVFKVAPGGAEKVLYVFGNNPNDGDGPLGGLINVGGELYGTTEGGGTNDQGTVFKVTLAGVETVLHSFGANFDGSYPKAGLIKVGHKLYGTTFNGGTGHSGTVFEINPAGVERVVYAFQGGADAQYPEAPLLNVGGTLYGTATDGGENLCEKGTDSCGAIFTVTLHGHEKVLYSFQGKPDGTLPEAGLINVNGTLYGTTAWGGDGRNCAGHGCGTIFKLTPAGVETVVHSLSLDEGFYPESGLLKMGHFLYGTAPGAGANGNGTVFAVEHH
jgi:uncharacterized repeat protein (TIGR03803 family)